MPQALVGLIGPIASAVTGGAGLIGSLLGGRKQNQLLNQQQQIQQTAFGNEQAQYNKFNQMTPAQVAQGVGDITPTLNANLTRSIAAQTDPATAEAGLAGSSGQLQNNLGIALAPYAQQNQANAMQLFQWLMGMPAQIAGGEGNLIQPMGQFMQQNTGGAGSLFGQGMTGIMDALKKVSGGGGGGITTVPTAAQINSGAWIPPDLTTAANSIGRNAPAQDFTGLQTAF